MENVLAAIWRRLEPALPDGVELERLVLGETPHNEAEYTGE